MEYIEQITDKALSGKCISFSETSQLLQTEGEENISHLLNAADSFRKSICGDTVTYVKNRNINFTNICRNKCTFCAFRKDRHDRESYCMTTDEILEKIDTKEITEVCIQGGLNEDLTIDYYIKILRSIKNKYPFIHIHAFSPMEISFMAEMSNMDIDKVLKILKDEGLDSIPGTAAEILSDNVRQKICPEKINSRQWSEIIKSAHKAGIQTTSTMMFGHIENTEDIAQHLYTIKSIQDETGGFTEFVPLPFISQNTELANKFFLTSGNDSLIFKVYAVSRLLFGTRIPNIQASWVKIGIDGVKKALSCGVNDIGGTLGEEKISKAAGSLFGESLTESELREIIKSAGRIPAQRDTLYNIYNDNHIKIQNVS